MDFYIKTEAVYSRSIFILIKSEVWAKKWWRNEIIKIPQGICSLTCKSLNQTLHYAQWPIIIKREEEEKSFSKKRKDINNRKFSGNQIPTDNTFSPFAGEELFALLMSRGRKAQIGKHSISEIPKYECWGKEKVHIKLRLYISLIEQIQFSFVISKSYTQLPAEECYKHFYAGEEEKYNDS